MKLLKYFLFISIFINCQTEDNFNTNSGIVEKLEISNVTNLHASIMETSGLINFNGRLITHNDSGGEPALYEIDITTGNVKRIVTISNAMNRDMEDITQDENYIYLGDMGNNSNKRTDQTIYKISKTDYLSSDVVSAEKITFSYTEQTDFSNTDKSTNFDAEALVNINNNLFLFTKNWGDLNTSVYKIPKEKGDYQLTRIATYNINGLITGGDYNKNTKTVFLTGYTSFSPFVVKLSGFSQNNPLDGKVEKTKLSVNGSIQIEGISANPDGSYYITAEELRGIPAILYKMTVKN